MLKPLDEKGWVFVGRDGNAYRVCMWGEQPWLFKWRDDTHLWESWHVLTQAIVWSLPHNLTQEQQDLYFAMEETTGKDLNPYGV